MANIDYSQVRLTVWMCGPGGNAPPGTILQLPHELVRYLTTVDACQVIDDNPYDSYNHFADSACTTLASIGADAISLTAYTFGKTYNTYV